MLQNSSFNPHLKMQIEKKWLGLVSYQSGLDFQQRAWESVKQKKFPVLLGLEHSNVITLGKRGEMEQDVFLSTEQRQIHQVELVMADRGGQATLHTPGQLVIYPIVDLRFQQLSVRSFVDGIEQVLIDFFSDYGVECFRGKQEPGIYTRQGKIAFLGLRIDRGVSRHGIAINVSNDLSCFSWIRSCGIDQEHFDQLSHYIKVDSLESLFNQWGQRFASVFK